MKFIFNSRWLTQISFLFGFLFQTVIKHTIRLHLHHALLCSLFVSVDCLRPKDRILGNNTPFSLSTLLNSTHFSFSTLVNSTHFSFLSHAVKQHEKCSMFIPLSKSTFVLSGKAICECLN